MTDRISLVTGAGQGIGLTLCRLLIEAGDTVVACPRAEGSEALAALGGAHPGRLHQVAMDVESEASIERAAREVECRVDRIDLLFNNAGVLHRGQSSVGKLDTDQLLHAYRVNAVGPLRVTAAFLPLLRKGTGRRLIQVTSLMGSIEDNRMGGTYGYRMSKAALNMAVRNLAIELGPEGFLVLAIHPGWVKTRLGGDRAPLALEPATAEVLRIALDAGPEENGAFLGPGGKRLPY